MTDPTWLWWGRATCTKRLGLERSSRLNKGMMSSMRKESGIDSVTQMAHTRKWRCLRKESPALRIISTVRRSAPGAPLALMLSRAVIISFRDGGMSRGKTRSLSVAQCWTRWARAVRRERRWGSVGIHARRWKITCQASITSILLETIVFRKGCQMEFGRCDLGANNCFFRAV